MKHNEELWNDISARFCNGQNINEIAYKLRISRSKIRKILITLGLVKSPLSEEILNKKKEGASLGELALEFDIPVSTLSTYLPYDLDKEKSDNARRINEYRERNLIARENSVKKTSNEVSYSKEEQSVYTSHKYSVPDENCGEYEGKIKNRIFRREQKADFKCFGAYRLHLELYGNDEDTKNSLKSDGEVKYGDYISRDIIVPENIQLWSIHYLIQRAFGWQNSHLHCFYLKEEDLLRITDDKAANYANLTGILFRSPNMSEVDRFWADDYYDGSFKTWLRKKYKGEKLSECMAESFWSIIRDMEPYLDINLFKESFKFYFEEDCFKRSYIDKNFVLQWDDFFKTGNYMISGCYPVEEPPLGSTKYDKQEILKFTELPLKAVREIFYEDTEELLERLRLKDILRFKTCSLKQNIWEQEKECSSYSDTILRVKKILSEIQDPSDRPDNQPAAPKVAREILYKYDFGDSWTVKITASLDAYDLIESGRATDNEIEEALQTCLKSRCPVMIARDGMDLCDDMGGYTGLGYFINAISENGKDKGHYDCSKQETLVWARSLGWSNRKIALKNRL